MKPLELVPQPNFLEMLDGPAWLVPSQKACVAKRKPASGLGSEEYRLTIKENGPVSEAESEAGFFYADQTLRQLCNQARRGKGMVSALYIEDAPRFPWRGAHLDVCRHFMPVEFVKRYIDLLAQHKINVFHWHLTDDQGWRIEIKKYPRLTEVGAWRNETLEGYYEDYVDNGNPFAFDGQPHGGFYTQTEIRDIVNHASDRHVTVVPEIELPGHARAALAAHPELGCTGGPYTVARNWGVFDDVYCARDETFEFLENVLSEVLQLFPGRYVHIGGDECPKTRWKGCQRCQARMKAEGLADEDQLQSYFVRRMGRFLEQHGRRLVGWDEILEGGLPPHATVMSWRGTEGGIAAARAGHDVIMAPEKYCYLDWRQSENPTDPVGRRDDVLTLETCYEFAPVPTTLEADRRSHILGGQGNLWTEYVRNPSEAEYAAFPRMCALAEVFWTEPEKRDWAGFQERLTGHRKSCGF